MKIEKVDTLIRKELWALQLLKNGQKISTNIDDCIAVIQFIQKPQKQINKSNIITIINVYLCPHQLNASKMIKLNFMTCIAN